MAKMVPQASKVFLALQARKVSEDPREKQDHKVIKEIQA